MRVEEIEQHLKKDLLPFWKNLKDVSYGGFYGEMDYDLNLHQKADKGCILNSRILWFFSNAYKTIQDQESLSYADHAYEYLTKAFYDEENGGVYWSVTYGGKPKDDTKHTYNQAFAIYALASYYGASKNKDALSLAYALIDRIETDCKDEMGYLEAFDRNFKPASNEKLSENGIMAVRTMNTLLHVYEAYTEVYLVDPNEKIADRLKWMLDLFADKYPAGNWISLKITLPSHVKVSLPAAVIDIETGLSVVFFQAVLALDANTPVEASPG